MTTNDVELPQGYDARPWGYDGQMYTEGQIRAAIESDRKRRGEPVGHRLISRYTGEPTTDFWNTGLPPAAALEYFDAEYVYAAPQPAEPRLDAPAQVGHTRFGQGVPWATVIGAAQRYHAIENTPTKEQERIKKAAERIKALQPAEPVKGPIDADIEHLAKQFDRPRESRGNAYCFDWLGFAHALLARYGSPISPEKV